MDTTEKRAEALADRIVTGDLSSRVLPIPDRLKGENPLVRYPKQWNDAFLVHAPGSLGEGESFEWPGLAEPQWEAVRELLDNGYVLGFIATAVESIAIAVEVFGHLPSGPYTARHNHDDDVLYIAKKP